MFGVQQHLDITICESSQDAETKGFVYSEGYTAVEIDKVVVVKKGTKAGSSTVDLVMKDAAGNKYVVMLTTALISNIPHFEGGLEATEVH